MLRVDADKDYQLAASSPVPLGTITDVLPGQLVQIIVQAVNGSQQGVASEPLRFRLPPAQTSTTRRSVEVQASAGQDLSPDAAGNGLGHAGGLTHRMPPRGG